MIEIIKSIEWIIMFLTITAQTDLDYGITCYDKINDSFVCDVYDTSEYILLMNYKTLFCQTQFCPRYSGYGTIDSVYYFNLSLTPEEVKEYLGE